MSGPVVCSAVDRERGAALLISLLLLLVLTVLGVTSLNNMTLEQRMAANFSKAEAVFQGAESGIKAVVFDGSPELTSAAGDNSFTPNPAYDLDVDPFPDVMQLCKTAQAVTPQSNVDPSGSLGAEPLDVQVQMTYQGWSSAASYMPGEELGSYGAYVFDVQSNATIGSGSYKAEAIHTQRVALVRVLGTGTPCPL